MIDCPPVCEHQIRPSDMMTPPGEWPQRALCRCCNHVLTRDFPHFPWVAREPNIHVEADQGYRFDDCYILEADR